MAVLNVQTDYNAAGDGTTDDTAEIRSAFNDATSGDTVYFPDGTYLVNGKDQNDVVFTMHNYGLDGVTIEGNDYSTVTIQLDGGHSSNHPMFRFNYGAGETLDTFEMRHLTVDMNRANQDAGTLGFGVLFDQNGEAHDVLFEHMLIEESKAHAFAVDVAGVTLNRCTARNCDTHGIVFDNDSGTTTPVTTAKNCVAHNCQNPAYGSGGEHLFENCFMRDTTHGPKTSEDNIKTTYRSCVIENSTTSGFRHNPTDTHSHTVNVVLEDVEIRKHADFGFVTFDTMGTTEYDIDNLYVHNNNQDGADSKAAQVNFSDDADLVNTDGTWMVEDGNNGCAGIQHTSSKANTVDVYYHVNNPDGAFTDDTTNLTVNTQNNESGPGADVPTEDEVGAGSGGSTAQVRAAPSVGASLDVSGRALSYSDPQGTLVELDSFEDYTVGAVLDDEAAEWHSETWSPFGVQNDVSAEGSQSAGIDDSGGYKHAQSNTDSSVSTEQGGTFSSYPFADCTIRCSVYIDTPNASSGYLDVAFGVPSNEADHNNNCYRVRGGDNQHQPFLRKTVSGTSTNMAQFNKNFSSGTWYDLAIEFQDDSANSNVELSLQVWEWDGSSWTDWGSISATDTDYNFPDDGGIAIAGNLDADGDLLRHDHFRFYDALGKTGAPDHTP